MNVFRGLNHPGIAPACALTIGNFDGVHRGHQAMLALLASEARQRGLPSCVMTFEPHPRDFFAKLTGKPEIAPARIGTLRDKLLDLSACGVDQTVVLPFNAALSCKSPQAFANSPNQNVKMEATSQTPECIPQPTGQLCTDRPSIRQDLYKTRTCIRPPAPVQYA